MLVVVCADDGVFDNEGTQNRLKDLVFEMYSCMINTLSIL